MTLYVRNSEITRFMECPRSWYVDYYLNLEPDWSERLTPNKSDVGNAVHAGLQSWYSEDPWERGLAEHRTEVYDQLHDLAVFEGKDGWDKVYEMAERMLAAYVDWVEEDGLDIGETTLLLEERLELPFGEFRGEDVIFYCQPDRIVGTAGDQIIVEDWKTGDIKRPFMFESTWQMLNYAMTVRTLWNQMPLGARHRRMNRSMHTKAVKSPQFAQHTVSFTEERLAVHWRHVSKQIDKIVELRQALDAGADPVFEADHVLNPMQCSWKCHAGKSGVCSQMDDDADWEHTLEIGFRKREDNIT